MLAREQIVFEHVFSIDFSHFTPLFLSIFGMRDMNDSQDPFFFVSNGTN